MIEVEDEGVGMEDEMIVFQFEPRDDSGIRMEGPADREIRRPFARFITKLIGRPDQIQTSKKAQNFDMDKVWSAIRREWRGRDRENGYLWIPYHEDRDADNEPDRVLHLRNGTDLAKALRLAVQCQVPNFNGILTINYADGIPSDEVFATAWPPKVRDFRYTGPDAL